MTKLRSLNIPSLTLEVLKILEQDKIKTVEALLFSKVQINLDPQVLARVIKDVQCYFTPVAYNLNELMEIASNQTFSIVPPCNSIASLFGGKVCSGQVIEFCGSSSSGKTQFCHYFSMLVAQTSGVYYIDTSLSFSASRIREMALHNISTSPSTPITPFPNNNTSSNAGPMEEMASADIQVIELLDRIRCFEIFDAFMLMNLLEQIQEMLKNKDCYFGKNLRLIVIDSIVSLIAPLIGGIKKANQAKYPQRQGHSLMIEISRLIKEIAVNYDVIVMVTNTLIGEESKGELRPALGASWVAIPSIRLILSQESNSSSNYSSFQQRERKGDQLFSATIESSNNGVLQTKGYFQIKSGGILDVFNVIDVILDNEIEINEIT